jgi:DNA modification methylase
MKYDEIISINGKKLTKHYIQSLNKTEREALIEPVFNLLRQNSFMYPDYSDAVLNKEYKRIVDFVPNLEAIDLFNNSSLGTKLCKHFCHKFYDARDKNTKTIPEIFNDDVKLRKTIANRLGLDWLENDQNGPGVNEAFNLSFRMIVQGFRSQRLVASTSMFKPDIAKYMYMKYSNEGDIVFDYSAGFGGRLLAAASCNRKYIATDPLTTPEVQTMADFFGLKNITLINSGSEHIRLDENSIDFSFSSPPYYNQEHYSSDSTQAYNNGEDYFYNTYWNDTLENVKYMLKPGKWFGLNVKNFPRMVDMAKDKFGPIIEEVQLRTIRGHLNKTAGVTKFESIYMFRNNK